MRRKSLVVVIPNPVVSDSEKQEDEMDLFDLIKLDNIDDRSENHRFSGEIK